MEQDLHTLLTSVRDDAPPPRLSVDDITAAGRHLVRRRRRMTLLSSVGGGAVTAIAVVTAALVLTGTPRALTPAVDPSSLPSAASPVPTVFADAPAFSTTYRGYRAGPYQVGDPSLVTDAYQQSPIERRPGAGPATAESEAADPSPSATMTAKPGLLYGGTLVVYRPEAFSPDIFAKGGEKVTTRTGTGLLAYSGSNSGPSVPPSKATIFGRGEMVPTLTWQYSDSAWAAIYWSAWETVPGRDELIAIADGLLPSTPRQFPVAFQATVVPRGYQLLSVSYGADLINGYEVSSAVRLTGKPAERPLYEPYNFDEMPTLTIAAGRPDAGRKLAGNLSCDGQVRCVRVLDSGDTYVSAEVANAKLSTPLTQVTLSIRVQNLDDTSAWQPAGKVFP